MWRTLNETLSSFCSSNFWDHDLLIFTTCFEETVLIWLPCIFLWIFTPLEIYYLRRSKDTSITHFNFYNVSKLIIVGLVGVTALVDAIVHLHLDDKLNTTHIHAQIIKFFTLFLFLGLTYANMKSGVRSSGILFIFSFLLAFCGIPQLLRLCIPMIDNIEQPISMKAVLYFLYYPLVLIVFLLNCFIGSQPEEQIRTIQKNLSPESTCSFLSKILYSWVGKFVWKGYKNPLTDDDLWDLDQEMQTAQNAGRFESKWHRAQCRRQKTADVGNRHEKEVPLLESTSMCKTDRDNFKMDRETGDGRKPGILLPLFKTFATSFIFGAVLTFSYFCLTFANPLILNSILEFASSENEEKEWRGFFYAFLFLATAILRTLSLNCSFYILCRIGLLARTALASVIYKKALKISNGTKKDFSFGEIINLMAVDAQRFDKLPVVLPFFCLSLLKVCVAFYFLWNILGPSVIAGVAVLVILTTAVGVTVSKLLLQLQMKQMKQKDKRIKLINEIVSGIKVLKLYAYEPSFEKYIAEIRDKEVRILKKIACLHAISSFAWTCSSFLVSLVTFGAYVLSDEKNVLSPQIAFVSLSLFNIMKETFKWLPSSVKEIMQTCTATKRINQFLNSEELDSSAVSHEQRDESIVIEDGEFSWDGYEGTSILRKIHLKVNPGNLVAIVGSVGSGKSSLLNAILGEMYKKSGYVNTVGRLAYVPQQAWIQNATLRDNITFGEEIKRPFYDSVLEACALIPDLEMMPAGDRTELGEKGINLSGGQKQRISLARAVYSEADTYLFDDTLSAVDVHVGKHIFEKVIGPNGMLKNKTRIFVTHNLTYLPQVDEIIFLENCVISETGTYKELLNKDGDFASLIVSYTKEDSKYTANEEEKIRSSENAEEEKGRKKILKRTASEFEGDVKVVKNVKHALTEAEESRTGNIKWDVCVYYLRTVGLIMAGVMLLSNVLHQIFSVSIDYWLSVWTSHNAISLNATRNADDRTTEQFEYLGVYALLGVGQAVNVVMQAVAVYMGLLSASKYIHNHLLTSVLRWPTRIFDRIPSGRIINRFSFDMEVLDNVLPANVLTLLLHTALVVSNLCVISYNTPLFICVFLPIIFLYHLIQRVNVATSRQLRRLQSASNSPIYSHFGDSIAGAQSIRAYGLQTKFIQTSQRRMDFSLKSAYTGMLVDRWFGLRTDLLGATIVFSVALLSVLGRNVIGTALVGLTITYALQITYDLFWMIQMFSEVITNTVAVERIKEYCEVEQEAAWVVPNATVPKNWPSVGEITFKNFRVRYHESMEPVLKGIDFSVNGGEKVGIIGRTGAGKTSLTLSLFRIIESAGGSILIDGVDISKIGLHTLRCQLTVIPQDPILFSGTLRRNLDLADRYSDDHIWRTLELINLKSYMPDLSHGLQCVVEEGGSNFSIGQRQLICLSRALLRKTKVLILDEATAAIDFETDNLIQAIIRKEFRDCTVLTIAHRLNTIMDYDKIMVLDAGRILEFDSPKKLLELKDSSFYSMIVEAGLL